MKIARRAFLQHSAAFTVSSAALCPLRVAAQPSRVLAYVGTYNTPPDGNGQGIELYEMNPANGELHRAGVATPAHNASWLALHPSRKFLYAGNEMGDSAGSVTAYAVNPANGSLQLLNAVSSEGAGPAHVSVDATGKYVFVANYAGGSLAVLPIEASGALGGATCVIEDKGSVGPTIPSSAPEGSFAFSGHDKAHAHMIQADPGNRFVLQTDLGQDRIYVYRFDLASGKLTPADSPFVAVPPGDGPRHFTFHHNGRWMYSLQEEASTVIFFEFDPVTGSLLAQQTISTLPEGFKGTNFTSEILLSRDGRYLYTANRLHDSIAIFSLDTRGHLKYVGETSTMGSYPRHIQFDPSGSFLFACDQRSDSIASFRVDKKTGSVTFTGHYTAVGSPACILFLG